MKTKIFNFEKEMEKDLIFKDWYNKNFNKYESKISEVFKVSGMKIKLIFYINFLIENKNIPVKDITNQFNVSQSTISHYNKYFKYYNEYISVKLKNNLDYIDGGK